ncbi:Golgi membrane exchange factor (Ric1p-Rgp1p) subunit [Taxawa tesnikishii (nom. ined.)]|nr:Golgi membrane exchange factor (Ric1p-Rgp1p) subunit [Dothideales sp. JES 119]
MPEALATIKRKFYKLLDPPSPSTSLHRPPTNTSVAESAREPTAKRIRSDEASPSAIILARIQARNASTTSVASKASTASSSKPAVPPKDPPNFLPWSHEGFLKRLKTFSPVTMWHPKPDAVNEVEWAKRGWSCVDTNTVACRGGCEKRVVVKLEPFARRPGAGSDEDEGEEGEEGKGMGEEEDDEYDEQLEHSLVERYRALIVNGHAEGCLWQQAGCKSDIYRLPVVRSTVWQPELKSRYASLVAISRSFRNVDLKPKDATPPPEKLLRDFPATLLTSPTNDIPPPQPQMTKRPRNQPEKNPPGKSNAKPS